MTSMYVLILITLVAGVVAWLLFLWAVRNGQYDDVEGPKYRMLDDDDESEDEKKKQNGANKNPEEPRPQ
jgi:cbb3-type cytochrome oxidase maturation protein